MGSFIRFALAATAGAFLFTAAPQAESQVTAQGKGYLLRMKFTPNQTATYSMSSKTTGSMIPQGVSTTGSIKSVTKSVKNGVATINYTIGPILQGGKQIMAAQTVTYTMDSLGRMKGTSGAAQQQQLQSLTLPQGPIAIGSTWTGTSSVPGPMGTLTIKTTYKLLGPDRRRNIPVMKIAVTGSATSAQLKANSTGTIYIRMVDGSLEETTTNQVMTMTMPKGQGNTGPQTMKVTNVVTVVRK